MTSNDVERSLALDALKRRAGPRCDRAEPKEEAAEAQCDARPDSALELIERTVDMDGSCALDRSSIEAFEALLTALGPADELRLTLALGGDAPVRLGMALGDGSRCGARREALTAGLDFAAALANARR